MSKKKGRQLIITFLKEHKILTAGTLLVLIFNNLLNVLLPVSIGVFYEIVFHTTGAKGQLLAWLPLHFTDASGFLWFFGGLILLKVLLTFIQEYCIDLTGEKFAAGLREKTFRKQLQMPVQDFLRKPVGKHLIRYSGDLIAARQMITKGILIFAGDLIFLCVTFGALYHIQPRLALIVLGIFLAGVVLIRGLSGILERFSRKKQGSRSDYLEFINARLQAFYTIKSFNRETPEINRFNEISRELSKNATHNFRFESFIQALYPLIQYGALAAVLVAVAGGKMVIPPADVFVFVLMLLYMRSVMRRIMQVNLVWRAGKSALKKWNKVLHQKTDDRTIDTISGKVKGALRFREVSFEFNPAKPVLRKLSFEVSPSSINWLQGKQGSGKGVVIKLIQKMLTPQSGQIYLDGQAYEDISAFDIRKNVTIVSAETPLLGATVFEAISYSAKPEKRPQAAAVLENLKLHFAPDTDAMLDFPLSHHGGNLSAGERVMLQFARALLTKKTIFLLDQPFAQLDGAALERVVHILNNLKKKHTIIITGEALPENLMIDQTITL